MPVFFRARLIRDGQTILCRLALFVGLSALPGCMESMEPGEAKSAIAYAPAPAASAPAAELKSAPARAGMMGGGMMRQATASPAVDGAVQTASVDLPPAVPRKIIYNAQLTLVVDDVSKLSDKVSAAVKDAGAYVSASDVASYTQTQRRATWTVRVPVERFDSFVASVIRFGEVQQNHVDSQDVTQEYYDLDARITNKQQEEKRLQKHLDESTGKLEDILAVEREITRVRGEIEQAQGRIRYLGNLASLSTVTITATEVQDYKPPVRPTFAGRIGQTFQRSVNNLVEFVEGIVLAVVGFVPWIPVFLVLAFPVLFFIRRVRKALRSA